MQTAAVPIANETIQSHADVICPPPPEADYWPQQSPERSFWQACEPLRARASAVDPTLCRVYRIGP
jgi:hypothetical protein